jgi:diguanylate cyclase (GGDEF)-like protein
VVLTSLMLVFALADRMSSLRRERDRAASDAERDGLTGALNRRGIDLRLAQALAEARRRQQVLAVLFVDIDHFKKVNDQFGHAVGDRCLDNVVARIGSELRVADSLGRYGGEEFVAVLPGAGVQQALAAAERIRADIEFRCREVDGHPVRITASIGVAVFDLATDIEPAALLAVADAALYQAKRAGRNRVVLAGDMPDEAAGVA